MLVEQRQAQEAILSFLQLRLPAVVLVEVDPRLPRLQPVALVVAHTVTRHFLLAVLLERQMKAGRVAAIRLTLVMAVAAAVAQILLVVLEQLAAHLAAAVQVSRHLLRIRLLRGLVAVALVQHKMAPPLVAVGLAAVALVGRWVMQAQADQLTPAVVAAAVVALVSLADLAVPVLSSSVTQTPSRMLQLRQAAQASRQVAATRSTRLLVPAPLLGKEISWDILLN